MLRRFFKNLKFIWKYDLNNCFKAHNDEIERLIEWNKNTDDELEQMRIGAREMFSMYDDEFIFLKKALVVEKRRITRQQNEQNKEKEWYLDQLREVHRELNKLKIKVIDLKK